MSELRKKYVVVGGWVRSQNDGQEHYVSSHQLLSLYKLNRKDAICMEQKAVSFGDKQVFQRYRKEGYEILRPRFDGNYSLDDEMQHEEDKRILLEALENIVKHIHAISGSSEPKSRVLIIAEQAIKQVRERV